MVKKSRKKHVPHLRFKGFLVAHGITQKEVAKLIGITDTTLSLKINGYLHFTFDEVERICNEYGIMPEIFLAKELNNSNNIKVI